MLAVKVRDGLIIVSGSSGTFVRIPSTPGDKPAILKGSVSFPVGMQPNQIYFYFPQKNRTEIHNIDAFYKTPKSVYDALQDKESVLYGIYDTSKCALCNGGFGYALHDNDFGKIYSQYRERKLRADQQTAFEDFLITKALIDYIETNPVFLQTGMGESRKPQEIIGAVSQNGLYVFGRGLAEESKIPQAISHLQHTTLLSCPQIFCIDNEICLRGIIIEKQPRQEQPTLNGAPLGAIVNGTTPLQSFIDTQGNQIPITPSFTGWHLVPDAAKPSHHYLLS